MQEFRFYGNLRKAYIVFDKLVDCLEKCLIYGHIRRFAN